MLNTPSGTPACFANSAMIIAAPGSRSEGFRMRVLPVATATGRTQRGIMAGKLNGQIAATTPSGTRIVEVSMSAETSSCSPII